LLLLVLLLLILLLFAAAVVVAAIADIAVVAANTACSIHPVALMLVVVPWMPHPMQQLQHSATTVCVAGVCKTHSGSRLPR
jgi:hypothetical protein